MFNARHELHNFAVIVRQAVRQANRCQQDARDFKRRLDTILEQYFIDMYSWCESTYENWYLPNARESTALEILKFKYMVTACVDTARRLTYDRIINASTDCLNDVDWKRFNIVAERANSVA